MENPKTVRKIRIFFYFVKKTLLVKYFQKYTFKAPASSHFCEIWESSKYSSINQDGPWNLSKIVHIQHASTERRELACISYSQFVIYPLVILLS